MSLTILEESNIRSTFYIYLLPRYCQVESGDLVEGKRAGLPCPDALAILSSANGASS